MQAHWKAIQLTSPLALAAFILTLTQEAYALTSAILVTAFIGITAYVIVVTRFRDRPDAKS